jgi:hypothetical protein
MKTYIGVKILDAEPCTLGEYNAHRGWKIPDDEDPDKPGFFLRYPDSYVSWSPAEIFKGAYRLISSEERALIKPTKPASFYDRLLAESAELEDRKEKLAAFITQNPAFLALPVEQRNLMTRQFDAMQEYAAVLGQRIATATPPPAELPVEGEVQVRNGDKSEEPLPFSGE